MQIVKKEDTAKIYLFNGNKRNMFKILLLHTKAEIDIYIRENDKMKTQLNKIQQRNNIIILYSNDLWK